MTLYEQMIEAGQLNPCTGLDWLMIQVNCEEALNGDVEIDEEFKSMMNDLMIEIEHFYRNNEETLNKLKEILTYEDGKEDI